jgi:hypothetical protein
MAETRSQGLRHHVDVLAISCPAALPIIERMIVILPSDSPFTRNTRGADLEFFDVAFGSAA